LLSVNASPGHVCCLHHESHIFAALPASLASPSKRKAVVYEEDAENIDPIIFASPKRTKGQDGTESFKPSTSHFVLTKAAPTFKDFAAACSPVKSTMSRPMLQPRSPAPKLNTTTATTLSAPAGRSPTRKRVGILNRRRTASSFTRIDPPKFSVGPVADAPFSIAAALSGTIPSYGARQASASKPSSSSIPRSILEPERKSGWFFDIHEDTPEETMTNLMEHSTCTLDISSDEETEARRRDERGKENVPPLDDVSQTQARLPASSSTSYDSIADAKARTRSMRRRKEIDEGAIEIDRSPLGDLEAEEFYAEGCTSSDVVFVADEEAEGQSDVPLPQSTEPYEAVPQSQPESIETHQDSIDLGDMDAVAEDIPSCTFDFSLPTEEWRVDLKAVDELMAKSDAEAPAQAKLFEPLEKAEEGFEVWESGSARGEDELVS
jgi:hypothetical protein